MHGLMRHIEASRNTALPGGRVAFLIGEAQVGWLEPDFSAVLAGLPGFSRRARDVVLDPGLAQALNDMARELAGSGLFRWRSEAFDVRAEPGEAVLAQLDRGALPAFGVRAEGVHVNGLVRRAEGVFLWIGRRAAHKALDPGKLDHLVAGGIPAGLDAAQTLVKEAQEEAGVPPELAARAAFVGRIGYAMQRPEGLRRDLLACFDLWVPESFVPVPHDDEVEAFALWPLDQVFQRVCETDDFKFNVNLVLIDLFLRLGLVDPASSDGRALRAALDGGECGQMESDAPAAGHR